MVRNVSRSVRPNRKRRNRLAAGRTPLDGPTRRAVFEVLEERAILTVAADLQALIAPYQSNIDTVLHNAARLPLVGTQLTALSNLNALLENKVSEIQSALDNLPATDGHNHISLQLQSIPASFNIDLNLDAFLKVSVSTPNGVNVMITPAIDIGFNYDNGTVTLDPTTSDLDIGFSVSLPGFTAQASLDGYLFTQIADQGTNFNGDLKFNFDPNDNNVSAAFSGTAHILFGLTLSFVDPSLHASFNPEFTTQLQLDWGIGSPTDTSQPTIKLKDFSLDADSFMHNFVGDLVTSAQKYTKPLEPFIDMFNKPVPIVSAFDSSETMGDLFTQNLTPDQKASFELMVKVVKAVNTFSLSGDMGGAKIDFGDITLTGDARTAGFSFDTGQLGNAIDKILNAPALHEVENVLQKLGSYAGDDADGGFTFPLLENPGQVIGGILTGQLETMFSFSTGPQHFELAPSISFGIKDLFGVSLTAGITFDADLTMGYDTAGLTKLINDSDHNPADLLHGFYFDNSVDPTAPPIPGVPSPRKTAVYLQGFAEVSVSAVGTLRGGIHANVSVELASTDNSPHVALDSMIQNLAGGGKVFNASGAVYATAEFDITLDTVIGPDITLFSYELARVNLLNYDPPPPPQTTILTVVHDDPGQHTLALDPSRMSGGSVSVEPFENTSVTDKGVTYVADGIQVTYPSEIDLYIERKNNATTNYYNLIGVNGAVPPGEDIEITDPFRLFDDEGVPNPAPAQTKPSVILAGGRNVVYQYNEASDGSHATVLLAGGYGSNTLSGGTIEFGNFIPADRVTQAIQQFDPSSYDAAGNALINSSINGNIAPADPTGVIGATMTAGRGGLMMGGAGNNSFIATGPGDYDMIGGPWINTFNISPSFDGVAATYQIDGGPFGQSQLIVRAPADESVTFENSTVPDKYNPSLKALAVEANAGLSATAHGIQAVHIVGTSGAHVIIGDTSEVNIAFSISGGAHLTFGGTNAPDTFIVSTIGSYYDGKDHVTEPKYSPTPGGIQVPATLGIELPSRLPDPVYSITRTFGTNNVTQTMPFTVDDEESSSIELNAGGASDAYSITMGVGAFIDVSVNDSDPTTQNSLTVNVRDGNLVNNMATLTDNSLHLDYYTDVVFEDFLPKFETGLSYDYSDFSSSVHYTPTVTFGANEDITFASAFPFIQTIVNRPSAPQKASIVVDGQFFQSVIPYEDLGAERTVFDASTIPYTMFNADLASHSLDVQANGGRLTINMGSMSQSLTTDIDKNSGQLSLSVSHSSGLLDTFNVHQNSGTATIDTFLSDMLNDGLENVINVLASSGTLNIQSKVVGPYGFVTADTKVNIGAASGLDDVTGSIIFTSNLSNDGRPSLVDIVVDGRGSTSYPDWTIDTTHVQIGGLSISGTDQIYRTVEAYWRTGTHVTIDGGMLYGYVFNGSSEFPLSWIAPSSEFQNHEADDVSQSLAVFSTPPSESVTYSATGLPPGLSLDSSTGLITGTIPIGASLNSPYNVVYTVKAGDYTVRQEEPWIVNGTIDLEAEFSSPVDADEGSRVNIDFYFSNSVDRPVTLSLLGAPSWLTLDPINDEVYGTPPVGSAADAPYHGDIHATDGVSSSDLPFELDVSGIKFAPVQSLRFNQIGDSVDISVPATTTTARLLTYSASNLPPGLAIDPGTGEIKGTLSGSQSRAYGVSVNATDGRTTRSTSFTWNVLAAGVSDAFRLISPGAQIDQANERALAYIGGESSQLLYVSYSVQGLPADFSAGNGYVGGTFSSADVSGSPYHVTVTATDGHYSSSTQFDWYATAAGTVTISSPFPQQNDVGSSVHLQINAAATSGHPMIYSATNLPNGLLINSQTGVITGTVLTPSAIPGYFNTEITASDGVNTASSTFAWTINTNRLALPDGGTIQLDSASGTEILAAVHLSTDAGPPGSIQFPFGFVTYSVQASLAGGATAPLSTTSITIRITGPTAAANNFYQYGPTPANPTPHWYSFLYNTPTDGDNATGTGAQFLGGGRYNLILIDGGRGDEDGVTNGVISATGGLAITAATDPYTVTNTNDSGAGSLRQAVINANGALGVVHTITFALPSGPQTINLQSPLPALSDPLIAVVDATQNVTILSSGGATDSFGTVVKTGAGSLAFGELSHLGGPLQVGGGLLRLLAGGTSSFAAGTTVTVSGSGALELAGTVSALNANINIANSSTATAGIVVSGQNQIVGAIDGAGNVAVSDGGVVTANQLTAGSLVIGSGGALTLAPSDASGNPVAQSASSIAFAASTAGANSPAVQDNDELSSSGAVTSDFAASLRAKPAASDLPVANTSQRLTFRGDWLVKPQVSEAMSPHGSSSTDDGWPSAFRNGAVAVVSIHPVLADIVLENHWAASGTSYSADKSWSDGVDDEQVRTLADELNLWPR